METVRIPTGDGLDQCTGRKSGKQYEAENRTFLRRSHKVQDEVRKNQGLQAVEEHAER